MVEIQISELQKKFADGTSVGPISFHVNDGELLALLGPSGSGKTTTLRMLAGFYKPDDGVILFDGKDVCNLAPNERDIGMVVQSVALFPNMSVFQNIAFALDVRDVNPDRIVQRVEKLSDMLGIRHLLHRRINEISGGEGQRVALARALVHEPQLLLLDEPLSALDPKLRENLQNEIRQIQRELGITTIYVTHNQEEAFAIADRIALLDTGEISQVGTPQELYDHPRNRFVAAFIGAGSIIEGTIVDNRDGQNQIQIGEFRLWIEGNRDIGEEVSISIKTEDVVILNQKGSGYTATILKISPQPGSYRVEMDFAGQNLLTQFSSKHILEAIKPGDEVQIDFVMSEIALLEE